MLAHDLHHIAELQARLALDGTELEGRRRHLGHDSVLLGAPAHPPGLPDDVAVPGSWASVLAHSDGPGVAHGLVRAVLPAARVVGDDGGQDTLCDVVVGDQARVELLEIEQRIVTCQTNSVSSTIRSISHRDIPAWSSNTPFKTGSSLAFNCVVAA